MSKRIKYILIIVAVLYGAASLAIGMVRLPSYSISTSGTLYIVNKLSRDIQVVDLGSGKRITEFPIGIEAHEAISTIDQKRVVLTNFGMVDGNKNIIKIIDTQTNYFEKVIDLEKGNNANGMVQLKETNMVLLVDYINGRLSILNIETGNVEKSMRTNQKNSHLGVLHPSKQLVYVTNMESSSVSVIDFDSGELISIIPCGLATESIDITPNGVEVWVTNKDENSISVIDTVTNQVVYTMPTGHEPLKLKFSIDGTYCLVANAGAGTITVYDQKSKKRLKTINIPGKGSFIDRILYHTPRPVNILMHPNGQYAFVSNSNARKIEVIDMRTFEIVSNIGTRKVPDALVYVE